jgi:hypothetical protein
VMWASLRSSSSKGLKPISSGFDMRRQATTPEFPEYVYFRNRPVERKLTLLS